MAITSYAELQTAVANWLDRSDLTARIPEFIELFEARANRVLRHPDMLTRDDSFTVDGQYETLPTRFLAVKSFRLLTDPVVKLEFLDPEELAEKKFRINSTGEPCFYTIVGGSFEFLPPPDGTYTASILFYQGLAGLATTDPNWLLTNHPDVYLFGALLEAEPYLHNDERLPVWKARLDEALREVNISGSRKQTGATPTMKASRRF